MKYDIAILGAGPGGYVAALYAAGCGKKVALIEKDLLGGVCLNRGCIPTKALISSLRNKEKPDFISMVKRKDEVVAKLRNGVEHLLKAKGIDIKKGRGKLIDKGVIDVGGEKIEAKAIIIATGSRPIEIPGFKPDGTHVTSSAGMLVLNKLPKKLLIVGGGYIGCEFGYLYNCLGVDVTIVEMTDSLIPIMDKELSRNMEMILKKRKVKIIKNTKADESMKKDFDKVLVCVGRRSNIEDLGLEDINIKTQSGRIIVDSYLKTNVDGVYAIGDASGGKMLAHVASHEGITAIDNILGKNHKFDYTAVPACIYTEPQLASVGLTKEEAESKGYKVKISKFPFSACGKAHTIGATEGFVKMIGDEKSGTILGVHMVGPGVTDLIAEATMMVKLKLKASDVAETIHAHPTLSEALMEATFALMVKPIHTL